MVAAGAALIAAGALAATGTITPVGVAVGGGAAVAAAGGGMMVAEEMCLGKDRGSSTKCQCLYYISNFLHVSKIAVLQVLCTAEPGVGSAVQ